MAIFTFGEGYHNYHHEFQHDYRNGVKPWNFDPTKWIIWTLSKVGFTRNLRRVAQDKILLAEQLRQAEIDCENAGGSAPPRTRSEWPWRAWNTRANPLGGLFRVRRDSLSS